jgi:hypothetical protein
VDATIDTLAGYLHWGFILISIPNLLLIGLMIVLFVMLVIILMGFLTLGLLLVPLIPGLRDIPRLVPIYRLILRRYYRLEAGR